VIEGTSTYVGGSLENAFLYPPAGTVFIIAKDVFEAVGGFKTDLPRDCHEDWNFHVRLMAREYRLHVLPEPVFAYRSVPLSRSLLVPQDMALLVEPFLESTPQMRKNLLGLTIELSGGMESAVRLLADYNQFAGGIRFLRFLNRLKRSILRPFRPRRKGRTRSASAGRPARAFRRSGNARLHRQRIGDARRQPVGSDAGRGRSRPPHHHPGL
jgi:hypothetical protein